MSQILTRSRPLSRAAVALSAIVSLVGVVALADAAFADRQRDITISQDGETYEEFPAITSGLRPVQILDPDQCEGFDFCHRIPVRIPVPEVGKGDDYRVRIVLEYDEFDDYWFYVWDNKQSKEGSEKQPTDDGYTPNESPYYLFHASSNPRGKIFELDQPDLVDYTITVQNADARDSSPNPYAIRADMIVETFTPPKEKTPPGLTITPIAPGATPPKSLDVPKQQEPVGGPLDDGGTGGLSILDEILADSSFAGLERNDLQSLIESPDDLLSIAQPLPEGDPAPPSGMALGLGLGAVPVALVGGGSYFFLRYRRTALMYA